MGRMHAPGKGISGSALPYKKTPPSWLKTTAAEVRSNLQRWDGESLAAAPALWVWLHSADCALRARRSC